MTDNMGNKNVRGNTTMSAGRASMARVTVPQMVAPTQPAKASPGYEVSADNLKSKYDPNSPIVVEVKPVALPFRSYQSGTLHTSNFEPSAPTPNGGPATKSTKRLSATSAVFVPSKSSVVISAVGNSAVGHFAGKFAAGNSAAGSSAGNCAGYAGYAGYARNSAGYAGNAAHDSAVGNSASMMLTLEKLKGLLTPPRSHQHHRVLSLNTATHSSETALTTPSGHSTHTAVTSPTYEVPKERKVVRVFTTRAEKDQKDVIITHRWVNHNVIRLEEVRDAYGYSELRDTGLYAHETYDFQAALLEKTVMQRVAFWTGNWVEIYLDIAQINICNSAWASTAEQVREDALKKQIGAVQVMNSLGAEFTAHTRTVFVTICCPRESSYGANSYNDRCTREQQESTAYIAIQNVANKLKELTSLARLEIVLRTEAHSPTPVSIEQLNYALPFYELPFTHWELKWQTEYMRHPEPIRGWPITYLDIERGRMDLDIAQVKREKELALEQNVFVHQSASPEVHDLPFAPRVPTPRSG